MAKCDAKIGPNGSNGWEGSRNHLGLMSLFSVPSNQCLGLEKHVTLIEVVQVTFIPTFSPTCPCNHFRIAL